jgi:hypothetical protein
VLASAEASRRTPTFEANHFISIKSIYFSPSIRHAPTPAAISAVLLAGIFRRSQIQMPNDRYF